MTTKDYLKYLQREIHTTVAATVDDEGQPVTCAVDIMDYDESGLYFLTAKGKRFYDRLKKRGVVALTGIKGKDTMHSVSVTVRGKVREIGSDLIPRMFAKNSYLKKIYPSAESQEALTVFKLCEGTGEWFDLSKKPIERASFAIGDVNPNSDGMYNIASDACIGCRSCKKVCPQDCIDFSSVSARIMQEHCLHCGNCMKECPVGAVKKSNGSLQQ